MKIIAPHYLALLMAASALPAAAAVCPASWQAGTTYLAGHAASHQGYEYRAKWWTLGENPSQNASTGQVWQLIGACEASIPSPSITPKATLSIAPKAIPLTPTPSSTASPTPSASPAPSASPTPRPSPSPSPVVTASPTSNSSNACQPEWRSQTAYVAKQTVSYQGVNYQAKWWTQGNSPDTQHGEGKPWQKLDQCATSPIACPTPSNTPTSTPQTSPTPASTTPVPKTPAPTTPAPTTPAPSPTPAVTPTPPAGNTPNDLLINEVAADQYGSGSWYEIYNPTERAISLNDVSLRTLGKPGGWVKTWPLSGSIAAKSYLVIVGNTDNFTPKKTSQSQYIGSDQDYPVWSNTDGSIELVRNNQTIDFVRFGANSINPLSASHWQGGNVASISGNGGYSLVRYYTQSLDSNTASDWRLVPFGTPAGRNDVDSNASDEDRDGIPSSAKRPGGTYAGLDLYAMGARAGRPTILLHVDWMTPGTDEGLTPRKEALRMVQAAFARRGIDLLIDTGQLYSASFSPADFNLGNGKEVPFARCVTLYRNPDCADVMAYKNDSMDVRRRLIFHYMLMGSTQNTNGYGGSSGLAEINGNDLLVTLGFWGLTSSSAENLYRLINFQAGTIMHELGHNLGLSHGGNEGLNNKLNYLSVMNYAYQLDGVPSDPRGSSTSEHVYFRLNHQGKATPGRAPNSYNVCDLLDGPCGNRFVIDYSDGSSAPLNETALNESQMLGRGSSGGAYADWNANFSQDSAAVSYDSNGDGQLQTQLNDYNDWAQIQLAFANVGYSVMRSAQDESSNSRPQRQLIEQPSEVAKESPPPAYLLPR
ncbi:carbohydrate-binding protein [Chitinibacter sp. GC72]|uniref:carbohydrate-binding protein n=1 Tax=Chitinibacter sp. GC72 TaxID=1526917 RepID=UPI0012FC8776|nr:carbohydrate-binding protein [Chitinibacter sp. GC72]